MNAAELDRIAADRKQLWDNGYPPIALLAHTDPNPKRAGKKPLKRDWVIGSRKHPPEDARYNHALDIAPNTGIAAHGLRIIDIDCGDAAVVQAILAVAEDLLGSTIIRTRKNSPRCALMYRAAEGEPRKLTLKGTTHSDSTEPDKIEVLGNGQQLVALGVHATGVPIEWSASPLVTPREMLPAVTEAQINKFLEVCAPIIGAAWKPRLHQEKGERRPRPNGELSEELSRARAVLLDLVPADDREEWIEVGAALYHETGGSEDGREIWEEWSAKSAKFNAAEIVGTWDSFERADGEGPKAGFGKVYFIAGKYGWQPQRPADDPGYIASLEASAGEEQARGSTDSPATDEHQPQPTETKGNKDQAKHNNKGNSEGQHKSRILSGADFLATFVPPDYVVDGLVLRARLYACTSLTGHGKTAVWLYIACMVKAERYVGTIETTGGGVVILAGENADDLCGRLHAMVQEYGLDPTKLPHVLPLRFPLTAEEAEKVREEIDAIDGDKALIIIDTGPSYYPGDDEQDNVQMGYAARAQRTLAKCRGRPAVVVLTHPVKNPDRDNLIPRGGGAYLNELDGNLTLWSDALGESTTLHWQKKLRGADFAPVSFSLRPVTLHHLKDAKGRPFISIVAAPQTDEQAEATTKKVLTDENTVLEWLRRHPGISLRNLARNIGWMTAKGEPNAWKVNRLLKALKTDKLVQQHRGKWQLTKAGEAELAQN
jgi:hypothetical protein